MRQSDPAWALQARIQSLERQIAILRNHVQATFGPATDADRLAFDSHFQPQILYHITAVVLVANRHFKNVPGDFLMLVIDAQRLTAPLKYEALDSAMPHPFPHIYGPLNRDAIVEVVKMIRAADGTAKRSATSSTSARVIPMVCPLTAIRC